jgi:hypothetical protein
MRVAKRSNRVVCAGCRVELGRPRSQHENWKACGGCGLDFCEACYEQHTFIANPPSVRKPSFERRFKTSVAVISLIALAIGQVLIWDVAEKTAGTNLSALLYAFLMLSMFGEGYLLGHKVG